MHKFTMDAGIKKRLTNENDGKKLEHCTGNSNGAVKNGIIKKPAPRTTFQEYVGALRPWSFSASLVPVMLGCTLAYKVSGTVNIWIALATCIAAISVHAAGNLVNTYFDYVKGVDKKNADDRTLVDHILTPDDVARLGGIFYMLGCLGFLITVFLSGARMEHLALIYFGGLSSSFLYTGGLGLKYIALGDILIFLTFGPVTVQFAFLSQCGQLSLTPLIYAIPLALYTEAILHTNNARDLKSDKQSGIITLAIILGETGSYILFNLLIFVPYIVLTVFSMHYSKWFLLPVTTIFIAFKHEKNFRQQHLRKLPQQVAQLNLLFGLLYTAAVGLTTSSYLPGLTQ